MINIMSLGNGNLKWEGYYYIPIRMVKIQTTENIKCLQGCGATGLLVGVKAAL